VRIGAVPKMSSSPARPRFFVIGCSADQSVELLSERRLAFEPKGWEREMRDRLRSALSTLVAGERDVLQATLVSDDRSEFDIENVLLSNVGVGSFARSAPHGIRLERVTVDAMPAGVHGYAYQHRYGLAPAAVGFEHWLPSPPALRFETVLETAASQLTAGAVWLAVKRGQDTDTRARFATSAQLGLRLRLTTRQPVNAAAMVKPLVDGVLGAFHQHDGTDTATVSERLSATLGVPSATIAALLADQARACLGETRLLWPWGTSVQWNPSDHRIVACELLIATGDAGRLTGELLEARPAGIVADG
jgi:hypothetical protein